MAFQLNNIVQSQEGSRKKTANVSSLLQKEITIFGKTFPNTKKEDFYTEISVLLKAGIHLKEAISLIHDNEKKKALKTFLHTIIDAITFGKSFSEALKDEKEITEYEYYSIQIGEETGTLHEVTESLGNFFAGKNEQRRNIVSALTYPIIILITALFVVVFMLRFVVPMFQDIFTQQQVTLPGITKFIISLSGFLKTYGGFFLLFILAAFLMKKRFAKKQWFRSYSDRVMVKLPFIGAFITLVSVTQFIQAMALLSAAKVPITHSIALVKKMVVFHPLKHALERIEQAIVKGYSLSESLKQNRIFDAKMVALIKVAEETNKTQFIFERLHQQYRIEIQQRSKTIATVMEPLIIVFIGILVGIVLIAMYLPMFKLSSVLG